jgi:biopolymer transport protein ExbD
MDWLRRIDVIVLALMLGYVLIVFGLAFWRVSLSPRVQPKTSRSRLGLHTCNLKSIAMLAPYLGGVGTLLGVISVLYGFPGGNMEKYAFLALYAGGIARSLITTAAGILVAVPATFVYNYLCVRMASIECEKPDDMQRVYCRVFGKFPLKKRFAQLPAFALVAILVFSVLVAAYTPYFDPPRPMGLAVRLVSPGCEHVQNDRITLLSVTNTGKVLINDEEQDWRNLSGRLSEIYRVREQRKIDLVVDKELSFQTAADAIDMVAGAESAPKAEPLDIEVRLITPDAINAGCVAIPSRHVPIRLARNSWR